MAELRRRLIRLEKTFGSAAAAVPCPLCHGYPHVAIHVMYESDPNGPGIRATGERYVVGGGEERVGPDLRCLRCGEAAEQVHLITLDRLNPVPRGLRVHDLAAPAVGCETAEGQCTCRCESRGWSPGSGVTAARSIVAHSASSSAARRSIKA